MSRCGGLSRNLCPNWHETAVEVMRVLVNKNPSDVALKLALTQVLASASPEEARTILGYSPRRS
jgi:hypothetical protein